MTTSPALRPGLAPLPARMRKLAIDHRGFPVPFFVATVDGKPDHRLMDPEKHYRCLQRHLCWLCGERLGTYLTFVIGPMCAINRISSEPPSHGECAEYAVHACPFLSRPWAVRRDAGMPEHPEPAGVMVPHNPGVTMLWVTKGYTISPDPQGKPLIDLGDPLAVSCWAEGRPATTEEVRAALELSTPILQDALPKHARLKDALAFETAVHKAYAVLGVPNPPQLVLPARPTGAGPS